MSRIVAIAAIVGAFASSAYAAPSARVGAAGVTLALPAGWHSWVPSSALTPTITDPLTRVVAVSAPFTFAASGCQVAAYSFPSTAVAIVVLEWVQLGRHAPWARRPTDFTSKTLPLQPPPAIECFNGAGGSVQFADHGRHFGVYVLAGRRASAAKIAGARAVLDSLRVQKS